MAKKSSVALPEGLTQKAIVEEFLNNGVDKPSDLVDAIKEKYGVEIGKNSINQVKTHWKKAGGATKPKGAVRQTPPTLFPTDPVPTPVAPKPKHAPKPNPVASTGGSSVQMGTMVDNGSVPIEVAKLVIKYGSVDAAIAELEKLR